MREKLIDLIEKCYCKYQNATGGRLADYLIDNGVTFATDNNVGSKWIPASDPPKETGTYIVQTENRAVTIAKYYAYSSYGRPSRWQSNRKVTHWMHMPEPTKEGAYG